MKKHLFLILALFSVFAMHAQTSLEGKVSNKETGEPVDFASVTLIKNGVEITGEYSDEKGNYYIGNIEPGKYDVVATFIGFAEMRQTGVVLKAGQTTRLNFEMIEDGIILDDIVVIEYKAPLVDVDNTSTGTTLSAEKINTLGVKNINSIVAQAAGISSSDGGDISIRGSRSNETVYFIDGIRSAGTIPQSEVDQLQVLTGGIEARYGDVTGGVISLTSKGPSDKFSGGFDVETSELLDGFGYNLMSANVSGPILKNSKGKSILGYRFSGQYRSIDDTDPSRLGVYRAPASVIQQLEDKPFDNSSGFEIASAERLKAADIGPALKARPTDGNVDLNVTAKIDARLSDNIDLSFSGNYINEKDRFTPESNNIDGATNPWSLFNWQNNPYDRDNRYRTNVRFRHLLGKQAVDLVGKENTEKSNIQNGQYTLQVGFERSNSRREDLRHEDRFGNYGYMGSTATTYDTVIGIGPDPNDPSLFGPIHLGYTPIYGEYTPNPNVNPVLAKYNFEPGAATLNGFLRTDRAAVWDNLYANVGQVYNFFDKQKNDQFTLNISTGFDVVPDDSDKGRHNIQLGVLYEQRVERSYSITPFELWRLGENLVNNHINGLNYSDTIGTIFDPFFQAELPVFGTNVDLDPSDKFLYAVREKLGGVSVNDYVNLSSLDPSLFTLDLFSPQELIDNQTVNYYGYDYLGNITNETTSFEDFFKAKDADGRRAFPVAPFTPIYGAMWLQDKFSFKDIIFRVGMRVDYFDANTKVLKDPYALYEIENAEDFYSRTGKAQPASVANDYKVYLDTEGSENVIGYRLGDTWYNPAGTEVANGNAIFNGGIVYPSYKGFGERILNIKDENFDPNTSFDDYKPQVNFMPRLSFSFPISSDAGFFANYDVLYSRPQSNSIMTALDYYNFENAGSAGSVNNSNLKPVRTTNYEVGFQQKLSQTTALKVSAYYREIKDLIQRRAFANIPSPINNYQTFDNLDFGTTKGFTFQFDRRRINNLELTATYTLQFAEGSGSDANSSANINRRGPIRNLVPLSFDERHRFTANADFRYTSGKGYDGPKVAGIDIFANAGVNLTAIAVSGQPFTKRAVPQPFQGSGFEGAINGNRKPWTFNIDGRVDKRLVVGKGISGRPMNANVYFRVENLLNTQNISSVYEFTGDPDDDGYLASPFGAARINNIKSNNGDLQSYLDYYAIRLTNGNNFFRPRRMYLGMIFDF